MLLCGLCLFFFYFYSRFLVGFFSSLMRIVLNLPYFSLFKYSQGEKILLDGTSIYSDEIYPSTEKMSYTDIPRLAST